MSKFNWPFPSVHNPVEQANNDALKIYLDSLTTGGGGGGVAAQVSNFLDIPTADFNDFGHAPAPFAHTVFDTDGSIVDGSGKLFATSDGAWNATVLVPVYAEWGLLTDGVSMYAALEHRNAGGTFISEISVFGVAVSEDGPGGFPWVVQIAGAGGFEMATGDYIQVCLNYGSSIHAINPYVAAASSSTISSFFQLNKMG